MKYLTALTSLLLLLLTVQCSRLSYDVEPDTHSYYHSMRIKVNVKNLESGKRQNFKVLFKYNQAGDKMIFLSPLNTVHGILCVENEMTTLVANKKKKFWRGEFTLLMQYMWGRDMNFTFSQFQQLMKEGTVPQSLSNNKNVKIKVMTPTPTPNNGEKPSSMEFISRDVRVRIKITKRKTAAGRVSLNLKTKGMKKAGLREILE